MIKAIKENHLVHIKQDLERIDKDNKEWHKKTDERLDKIYRILELLLMI